MCKQKGEAKHFLMLHSSGYGIWVLWPQGRGNHSATLPRSYAKPLLLTHGPPKITLPWKHYSTGQGVCRKPCFCWIGIFLFLLLFLVVS